MDSIYTVKIADPEYVGMANDIARFTIIQLSIQIMLVLLDSSRFSFFGIDFLLLLMFVIIGVMLYWLIFRKLISFI